jgi:hypothetical protein
MAPTRATLLALCVAAAAVCMCHAAPDAGAAMAPLSHTKSPAGEVAHSEAFLGFMREHGKDYCHGQRSCEVSVLREKIYNLNKEAIDAHNTDPGQSSQSSLTKLCPEQKPFSGI